MPSSPVTRHICSPARNFSTFRSIWGQGSRLVQRESCIRARGFGFCPGAAPSWDVQVSCCAEPQHSLRPLHLPPVLMQTPLRSFPARAERARADRSWIWTGIFPAGSRSSAPAWPWARGCPVVGLGEEEEGWAGFAAGAAQLCHSLFISPSWRCPDCCHRRGFA